MRRAISGFSLILLSLGITVFLIDIQPAMGITIRVPDDYPTIQTAINAANDGDTVYVQSGTYVETVTVNKRISLRGENRETTIIDGDYGTAISISADNALVEGFALESHVFSHGHIVYLQCTNSILRGNTIHYTITYPPAAVNRGITMVNCTGNIIENNNIEDIQENGIYLLNCDANTIRDNVFTNTYWGIGLWSGSTRNIVKGNTIMNTAWGYEEMQYHPGFPPVAGIAIWGSGENEITDNIVVNNSVTGICMLGSPSKNNLIVDNVVYSNGHGSEVTWHGKAIVNSDVWVGEGIGWPGDEGNATGNTFYHNYFTNQSMVYCEYGGNKWDNDYPSGGNYWEDYEEADVKKGPDQDQPGSDGIGDTAIQICNTADRDRYPLMYPFGEPLPPTHTLTITSAANGTTNPTPGGYVYSEGQNVPVRALPELGYILDYWELDGANAGISNPISVTMNADHTLYSTFTWAGLCELTITTTAGGTTNPPPGTEIYTKGNVVNVTALSDTGHVFDHWELDGANFGTAESVNVTMNTNHTLHATFTPTYNLTITTTTGGTTNPTPATYTHLNGTIATITAIPDTAEDYYFDYWILDGLMNSSNPINIEMTMDHTLHAIFAQYKYILTLTVTAGGTTNPPAGTHIYSSGTEVNITATPEDGYYLDYWMLDGVIIGYISTNPAVVDMAANHTLHVAFAQLSSGHDVAVKSVSSPKTVVGQGFSSSIHTLAVNIGSYTENFNITIHIDETAVESQEITLESGAFVTLALTWNTTGFSKGNYTIEATADAVPDEANLGDNSLTDGWIIIAMIGDITGDGKCDIKDLATVAKYFGQTSPPAPANCDVTGPTKGLPDGKIDIRDIATTAIHFGEVDP